MEPKRKNLSFRNCFTLIELLVVVSIIAILASLLLPALSKARWKSKVVTCAGNMKQVAMAATMYAGDNDDLMPIHGRWNVSTSFVSRDLADFGHDYLSVGSEVGWAGAIKLEPFNNVLNCPAQYGKLTIRPGYGWDGRGVDNGVSSLLYPGFVSTDANTNKSEPHMKIRLTRLAEPATRSNVRDYMKFMVMDKTFTAPTARSNNHGTGGNYTFGDGHVEWITYSNSNLINSNSKSAWQAADGGYWWYPRGSLITDQSSNGKLWTVISWKNGGVAGTTDFEREFR